jgi:hypothetical protein
VEVYKIAKIYIEYVIYSPFLALSSNHDVIMTS